MGPDGALAHEVRAALWAVRSRDAARDAMAQVRARGAAPHRLRAALAEVLADRAALERMVWPAVEGARETLVSLDGTLDSALIATLSREPLAALADELAACGADRDRAHHAVDAAWRHLAPPGARAAAVFVDLLRARPLGPARTTVYEHLVSRGVDIRGALADDRALGADERSLVLSAFAARRADRGALRTVDFRADPTATLARSLADWTAFATHPRQLFFAFRRARSLDDAAYTTALDAMSRWPMAPEVRAQWERERSGEPRPLPARPIGAGRYECARCGARGIVARGRHALDAVDPVQGAETEFACEACEMRYFATWEIATLYDAEAPAPVGWSSA